MTKPKLRHTFTAAIAAVFATSLITAHPARAVDSDQQADVDHALGTLNDLRNDKAFGTARELMHTARAVLIAPRIFKAGFFFGGEGGSALLMVRGPHGWSDPAFYTIASATFGLQIGAEQSEMIIFIQSGRALDAVMRDHFKIGADASLAVATLGSSAGGATTGNAGADLIAWASSAGAYAGVTLNGSVIEPQLNADANYYGRSVTTSDIVMKHEVRNPAARPLVKALDGLS